MISSVSVHGLLAEEGAWIALDDVLSNQRITLSAKLKYATPTGEEENLFVRPRGNVMFAQTAGWSTAQLEAC